MDGVYMDESPMQIPGAGVDLTPVLEQLYGVRHCCICNLKGELFMKVEKCLTVFESWS